MQLVPPGFKGKGNFIVQEQTTEISTSPFFTSFPLEIVNCNSLNVLVTMGYKYIKVKRLDYILNISHYLQC